MQKIEKLDGMPTYSPEDKTTFKIEKREYEGQEIDVIMRKGHPGITIDEVNKLRAEGKQVPDFSICAKYNPRLIQQLKLLRILFVSRMLLVCCVTELKYTVISIGQRMLLSLFRLLFAGDLSAKGRMKGRMAGN